LIKDQVTVTIDGSAITLAAANAVLRLGRATDDRTATRAPHPRLGSGR
jgi:hypothetical protein